MKTLLLVILFLGTLPCFCRAQLVFESKTVEKTAGLDDEQLEAEFKFHNAGTYPVRILKVKPSCNCTVAKLEKELISPGESDAIKVVFKIGNRRGTEVKTLSLLTDDHAHSDAILRLVATISELIRLDPAFVYWKIGDKPEPKEIKLLAASSTSIHVTRVDSDNPSFRVTLKTVIDGQEYLITIEPEATSKKAKAELHIETDLQAKRENAVRAYAQVK